MSSGQSPIWQTLFKTPIKKIEKFHTLEQKQCLAMAMAMATKIEKDQKEPVSLYSPSLIEATCNLSIADQHEYGVCLKKSEAFDFLSTFTGRDISRSSFIASQYANQVRADFLKNWPYGWQTCDGSHFR